jgi:hypothetical protein
MPPDCAVILDNFIPRAGYVEMRKGSAVQASGVGADVQTLMAWRGPAGDKLIAASGGGLYDVTAENTVSPAPLWSGGTLARWSHTAFANSAGTWLVAVNGADAPVRYDGTSVTAAGFTGSGLTSSTLSLVMAHKSRLHFAEAGTLHVWFAGLDAVGGSLGLLDLGPVFAKGGALAAIGTCSLAWTTGLDDFAVYVTSQGQVAVYQGTDPGLAASWALVGVYDLAPPLGPRALIKYGAELAILTTAGIVPLSQALRLDRAQDDAAALTQRIAGAFQGQAQTLSAGWGWQGMLYPAGALAVINVPSSPAQQFVQNLQTGAWCRFTGLDAACWGLANGLAYWARGATVYRLDVGADDAGTPIVYDLKGAWSDQGYAGLKRFTLIRPLMTTVPWITPALEIDVDFRESAPVATATVFDASQQAPEPRYAWGSASGVGVVGAPRMRIQLSAVPQTDVAVDGSDIDEVGVGDGSVLVTADPTASVPFQLAGFDLAFEPGGGGL